MRTRSHFEKITAADIAARGLEAYLPLLQKLSQWKDRRKRIEAPLFSGYLFARFIDSPEARLAVLRSNGAVSILGHGGAAQPVPDAEVDAVKRLLQSNAGCLAHPLLKEGGWVRVARGPLQGLEGLLVRFRGHSRLVVAVELLSQSVSAEIDAADVEPAARPLSRSAWSAACAG